MQRSFASKLSESYFSFTPGFSPVIIQRETHKNRFNGINILDASAETSPDESGLVELSKF
jgi:hypothetical protein